MNDSDTKPWIERVAEELSKLSGENKLSPEVLRAAMEATAEMRCVAMKVALARCYEILWTSRTNDKSVSDEEFEEYLLELFQ